jgi:hypothetical protein
MTDSKALPNHIRAAIIEMLNYCMHEEANYEASSATERESHIWTSITRIRDWLTGTVNRRAKPEFSIGIHNDDGDCYDVVIKQKGRPIATLISPEAEVQPLVHAGNCYRALLSALRTADIAIIEVADLMLYEDNKPVTFLESSKIERAYFSLVGALPEIKRAFTTCRFGQDITGDVPGGDHV